MPDREQVVIPTRHVLALCEYPVPAGSGSPEPEEGCEEPAVAVWEWPGDGGRMFVCAKHDAIVMKEEKEAIKKGDSEYGDYEEHETYGDTYIDQKESEK